VELLRLIHIERFSEAGCFEGINYFDEVFANTLLDQHVSRHATGWSLSEANNQVNTGSWDRLSFAVHSNKAADSWRNNVLWWNPQKNRLPRICIPREVSRVKLVRSFNVNVQQRKHELIESLKPTPELMNNLLANRLIFEEEYMHFGVMNVSYKTTISNYKHIDSCFCFFKQKRFFDTNAAWHIYTYIINRLIGKRKQESKFLHALRSSNNNEAANILTGVHAETSSKYTVCLELKRIKKRA